MLKLEKYYDIGCSVCGRHWSTDYGYEPLSNPIQLRKQAKIAGWKEGELGDPICPMCAKELKISKK